MDEFHGDPRIEALYREIEAARRELVALIKDKARRPVDDVELSTPAGPVRLSALFGAHDELLVSFNMGTWCAYCTLWADSVNPVVRHLETRAGFVVVSPDPPEVQAAFAAERGWRFRMASHQGTSFAADMGFAARAPDGQPGWWPGVASFRRTAAGIERVAMTFYGPYDPFCSVYHYLGLLQDGSGEFEPGF